MCSTICIKTSAASPKINQAVTSAPSPCNWNFEVCSHGVRRCDASQRTATPGKRSFYHLPKEVTWKCLTYASLSLLEAPCDLGTEVQNKRCSSCRNVETEGNLAHIPCHETQTLRWRVEVSLPPKPDEQAIHIVMGEVPQTRTVKSSTTKLFQPDKLQGHSAAPWKAGAAPTGAPYPFRRSSELVKPPRHRQRACSTSTQNSVYQC